jgi:hypothetical protein
LEFLLSNRLSRALHVARFFSSPRDGAAYIGWLGFRNLGDEVLFEVAERCMAPMPMSWMWEPSSPLIGKLLKHKRHACTVLGGGTQIGDPSPLDWFKDRLAQSDTGAVFGAGVDPSLEGPIPAWLEAWGDVLRRLPYVGVRGPESAATLARVGVKAENLGDPVCWFSSPVEFWQPQEKVLGLNVGHSYGHMFGSEDVIQKNFITYAKTMRERGWRIEFFCVWPDDLNVTQRVASEAGIAAPVIHCIYESADDYLQAVRRMKVFTGIKLHAVAMAMCANVPALMVGYRAKCREFMSTIGMESHALRSDNFDAGQMLALTESLDSNGATIAARTRAGMAPIQARMNEVGQHIVQLARTSRGGGVLAQPAVPR